MAKYKVELYGWELEANCFSLNERQTTIMDEYIEENGGDCLSKMGFDIEEMLDIDMFDSDVFNISKPFYYDNMTFIVFDENDEEVIQFNTSEISFLEDILGNDYVDTECIIAMPDILKKNLLLITHESKGGIYYFYVESNETPKPEDFSVMGNVIETPDGEYDIVEDVYYKGNKIEIEEWLGGDGKGFSIDYYKIND